MRNKNRIIKYSLLLCVMLFGLVWSLALARQQETDTRYPNGEILVTADWLARHADEERLVIVDVRNDGIFDGRLIPAAIRLPWSEMRYNNTAVNEGSLFVGAARAQEILGEHGIGRTDTVVIYDSVAEDGGATASYVFLILDYLGHDHKMILEGGIDAWISAGYQLDSRPRDLSPILYQAPIDDIRNRSMISGTDIYKRLDDPHYQIVDVRSEEEYLGKKGTRDLKGNGLKLGHIPTAINIGYGNIWIDKEKKLFKPYAELQELYRGLDPGKTIIVYCNSGRRSSFVYFTLRLMGFKNVRSYEASWKQWGKPANFYPVETSATTLVSSARPKVKKTPDETKPMKVESSSEAQKQKPAGGYVSCGG